jgi:hypothetical protein
MFVVCRITCVTGVVGFGGNLFMASNLLYADILKQPKSDGYTDERNPFFFCSVTPLIISLINF